MWKGWVWFWNMEGKIKMFLEDESMKGWKWMKMNEFFIFTLNLFVDGIELGLFFKWEDEDVFKKCCFYVCFVNLIIKIL